MQTESNKLSHEPFVLPASFAQQRMWFLDRFESGGVYNVPWATRLRGRLDIDALERALGALIERHESLRTVFALTDGVPHQLIRPARPFALEVIDLRSAPAGEERALRIASEQARTRFDLSSEEPLRVLLIKLGDEDHVLSLTLHHIVTDAWSMGVLRRELSELYGALCEDRAPELPELAIQYGDYAVWQQQWMDSGGLDHQLEYWKRKLAGAPPLLELPTDKPRPTEQTFNGATLSRVFARELGEAVRSLGEREGATMFMTLLAAFMAMLARYSGQRDLVVATPVANRNRVELEQLIGLLVNTLAVRVDAGDDLSFLELLRQVRETALEAFSNQDLPFEKLVAELGPERNLSHAPIAQVLFVLQTADERPALLAGLDHERVPTDRGTAKFDLSLFVGQVPDGLRVAIEYCTDLFEETTIARMLEHYGVLLQAAVAVPTCPIGRLPLLSDDERELVLRRWQGVPALAAPERSVHELFAEQVQRTPDAIALESASRRFTYAQLDACANRLAAHLCELGAGPDQVVAIAADRSVEMAIGVLAVLKAGSAYAPIDPGYPSERVAFMLADSGAPVLLTQRHLLDGLPVHRGRTVCLEGWRDATAEVNRGAPHTGVTPDHVAYLIYTSGSTGRPKGVAMTHRPLVNLLAWHQDSLPAAVGTRTLQFASLSFDVAFQELFSTWCSGGTLVMIEEATRRDAHALLRTLRQLQIERLFVPFVALQSLAQAAAHLELELPTLREVITAGEQLKATAPVRRFFAGHPRCKLINHYGPTETHVVTSFELAGPPDEWPALPPIGRPITGSRVYLLDRHRQPVPIGLPGELYVGGRSVARGYLGRDELTSERFIRDPFDDRPGARMYRTGDLARHLPDGNLAFLGRADDQVKVRGFRVELGEVEAVLAQHDDVAQVVAMLREDHLGDPRLVAYVVAREGAELADHDLLAHARRLVPDHMIPQHFVIVDAVPLTPSGKLDRRALPAPNGRSRTPAGLARPGTELERSLADIWRRLLKVAEVGVDDDFFELGGHSLLAVQLVHQIEQQLGRTCTLPMLFRNGTIRALAAELRAGGDDATEPTSLKLANSSGPAVFCICGVHAYQELAEELAPDYALYGIFLPFEQELFSGPRGRRAAQALSVEQMAARYLAVVREQQPHGPYLLLGLCFGGILAYEVAQQLRRAGEEVSLLVMLDSTLSSLMRRRGRRVVPRLKRSVLRRCEYLPRSLQRRLLGEEWLDETNRLVRTRARIYADAMRRYRVSAYGGSTVLVRPESSVKVYEGVDDAWGWDAHISKLEVFDVPGAHQTHLKRPNAHGLARMLRPHLERARASLERGR